MPDLSELKSILLEMIDDEEQGMRNYERLITKIEHGEFGDFNGKNKMIKNLKSIMKDEMEHSLMIEEFEVWEDTPKN
jgi:hypothetical protein